jgi:hypothetical protein
MLTRGLALRRCCYRAATPHIFPASAGSTGSRAAAGPSHSWRRGAASPAAAGGCPDTSAAAGAAAACSADAVQQLLLERRTVGRHFEEGRAVPQVTHTSPGPGRNAAATATTLACVRVRSVCLRGLMAGRRAAGRYGRRSCSVRRRPPCTRPTTSSRSRGASSVWARRARRG